MGIKGPRVRVPHLIDSNNIDRDALNKRLIHELCQAGWTVEDPQRTLFRAPWGTLYIGPQGAYEVFSAHTRAEA